MISLTYRLSSFGEEVVSQPKGERLVVFEGDGYSLHLQDSEYGGLPTRDRLRKFRAGNIMTDGKLDASKMKKDEDIMKEVREYARFMWNIMPGVVGRRAWDVLVDADAVHRPKFNEVVHVTDEAYALLLVENHWKSYWSRNLDDDGEVDYSGMTKDEEMELKLFCEVSKKENGIYITKVQSSWNKAGKLKFRELRKALESDREQLGRYMDRAIGELIEMEETKRTGKKRKRVEAAAADQEDENEGLIDWKAFDEGEDARTLHPRIGLYYSSITPEKVSV